MAAASGGPGLAPAPNVIFTTGSPRLPWQSCAVAVFASTVNKIIVQKILFNDAEILLKIIVRVYIEIKDFKFFRCASYIFACITLQRFSSFIILRQNFFGPGVLYYY